MVTRCGRPSRLFQQVHKREISYVPHSQRTGAWRNVAIGCFPRHPCVCDELISCVKLIFDVCFGSSVSRYFRAMSFAYACCCMYVFAYHTARIDTMHKLWSYKTLACLHACCNILLHAVSWIPRSFQSTVTNIFTMEFVLIEMNLFRFRMNIFFGTEMNIFHTKMSVLVCKWTYLRNDNELIQRFTNGCLFCPIRNSQLTSQEKKIIPPLRKSKKLI